MVENVQLSATALLCTLITQCSGHLITLHSQLAVKLEGEASVTMKGATYLLPSYHMLLDFVSTQ